MMKTGMLCVGLALFGQGTALGAEAISSRLPKRVSTGAPVMPARDSLAEPTDSANLLVEIAARHDEMEGSARFIVGNGAQANHVVGGDKPFTIKNNQGTGVEFKKWGFIFNVLPRLNPKDRGEVFVQMQVELSGPVKGVTIPAAGDVQGIATWQYQSSFTVKKGLKTVVVESPARVEITVSEAPVGG
ncbi:MAG: hypothetical protein HY748_00590 [Elusimicrobia bacterium]|nr:hypothetical protein [Elusimicrobiota bacterium]